jgi:protein TonB
MSADTIILPSHDDSDDLKRWSLCAAIVLAVHFGLFGSALLLPSQAPEGSPLAPVVIIDLAPLPAAPSSPVDLAPGPEMVESTAQTEAPPPVEAKPVEPMPKVEAPAEVTLPPPEQQPAEPKPVEQPEVKKTEAPKAEATPPAPLTTATPRSELRDAPVARAPSPGNAASNAAIANWQSLVVARLQQAKRYPTGAEGRREQGVATLSFSVDRNGRVLSRDIARSSGFASLDQEALALVRRAEPLPPFPPAMTQAVVHLTVPIRFSLR